jgi:hypothetical protein
MRELGIDDDGNKVKKDLKIQITGQAYTGIYSVLVVVFGFMYKRLAKEQT